MRFLDLTETSTDMAADWIFEKFKLGNLVNFISCTFGTAWDKYSKNGLTYGHLREKKGRNFYLEIFFFKQKQDFGIFI